MNLTCASWPSKTIRHLFYATSSFVLDLIVISEFTELQSGNALFGLKSTMFCVPLRFDGWPWITIGHFFYASSSFVHHFIAIDELMLELQSGNTLFGSKSTFVIAAWPWNLTDYLEKTTGHLCNATSNIAYHFVAIGEFTLKLQSGNAQFGSKSTIVFSRVTLKFNGWPWKTIGHLS